VADRMFDCWRDCPQPILAEIALFESVAVETFSRVVVGGDACSDGQQGPRQYSHIRNEVELGGGNCQFDEHPRQIRRQELSSDRACVVSGASGPGAKFANEVVEDAGWGAQKEQETHLENSKTTQNDVHQLQRRDGGISRYKYLPGVGRVPDDRVGMPIPDDVSDMHKGNECRANANRGIIAPG